MQSSMVPFTFLAFDGKYPCKLSLFPKIKIVSLSWNLIPTQLEYVNFNSDANFLFFLTGNTIFE